MSVRTIQLYTLVATALYLVSSCIKGPGLFKQDDDTATGVAITSLEDADGVITGQFNAAAGTTQTLAASASGDLAGSYIAFPAGSLSISTSITIEQGISFAGATSGDSLGIGNMTAGGPSVVIESSEAVDADNPFTLQIPASSSSSLALSDSNDDARTIILFQYKIAAEGKEYLGMIPRKKLKIENGYVIFETKYFGAYQVAITETVIEEEKKVAASAPILTKAKEKHLEPVEWSVSDNGYKPNLNRAIFVVSATGFKGKSLCTGFVHEKKELPPVYYKTYNQPKDITLPNSLTFEPTNKLEHNLFAKFECRDENGRIAKSPWSNPIAIPNREESAVSTTPELPNPQFLLINHFSRISLKASWPKVPGATGYILSYKPGAKAPVSCNDPAALVTDIPIPNPDKLNYLIRELTPGNSYSFRICSVNSLGLPTAGIEQTNKSTDSTLDISCNGGNIDNLSPGSACDITSISGSKISGEGHVKITSNINHSQDLTIDVKGTLTIHGASKLNTQSSNLTIFAQKVIFLGANSGVQANGEYPGDHAGSIEIHAQEIRFNDNTSITALGGAYNSSSGPGGNGGDITLGISTWVYTDPV